MTVPSPTQSSRKPRWLPEAITYALSGLLCCGALVWALQLWRADPSVPLYYGHGSDISFQFMLAKDVVDHGWYLHNPRLGAPGQQDLGDFPMPDLVTFVSMKVMSWFTSSWAAIIDVYFFTGFLLATWSALAVLRHFGMARAPAVLASVLFAFAPYHFYRGEWHLQLSEYFVVPLAGLLTLWVMSGERLFTLVRRSRFLFLPVPSKKGLLAIACCAVLGSDGAYYAFFTIFLLAGAGLYRVFEGRKFHRAGTAALLAGVILLALVLNLLPNIVHFLADGKNPQVAARLPSEAETFALKLTQLVMPIPGHRIPWLAHFKAAYDEAQPGGITEADAAALGTFGTAGFCFLLLSLFAGYPSLGHPGLIRRLSVLNLWAFLIGTLGGIGSLVAWTITTQIRAYNRISIFISFFSITAAAAVLDAIWRKWARTVVSRVIGAAALAGMLAAGLFDQVARSTEPSYERSSALYRSDLDFATHAERWLPHGTMILELPILDFPETQAPGNMVDYDPVIPYLNSTTLRWSYGAIKGRYWGLWQDGMISRPIENIVDTAAASGFGAIYIDRNGYADKANAMGAKLDALGIAHIEARNGRYWLYDIRPYAARMQAAFTPANWERMQDVVLHPLVLQWLPACSAMEGDARQNWHWCGASGGFQVDNSSSHSKRLAIRAGIAASTPGACSLHIDGPGWNETVPLTNATPRPLVHSLEAPPGTSFVRMTSDCQRLVTTDPRPLVFRIDNFSAGPAAVAPEVTWSSGFYDLEKSANDSWHWCSSSGDLTIRNPGAAGEAVIHMVLASAQVQPSPLSITGPGFGESVTINPAGAVFSKRFLLPQGGSVVHFSSPATPLTSSKDPRKLVFLVKNLGFENASVPEVIYR